LDDEEVDLVVVSTPNKTHFEYVKAALEHRKHGDFLIQSTYGSFEATAERGGKGGCRRLRADNAVVMCEKPLTPNGEGSGRNILPSEET